MQQQLAQRQQEHDTHKKELEREQKKVKDSSAPKAKIQKQIDDVKKKACIPFYAAAVQPIRGTGCPAMWLKNCCCHPWLRNTYSLCDGQPANYCMLATRHLF